MEQSCACTVAAFRDRLDLDTGAGGCKGLRQGGDKGADAIHPPPPCQKTSVYLRMCLASSSATADLASGPKVTRPHTPCPVQGPDQPQVPGEDCCAAPSRGREAMPLVTTGPCCVDTEPPCRHHEACGNVASLAVTINSSPLPTGPGTLPQMQCTHRASPTPAASACLQEIAWKSHHSTWARVFPLSILGSSRCQTAQGDVLILAPRALLPQARPR